MNDCYEKMIYDFNKKLFLKNVHDKMYNFDISINDDTLHLYVYVDIKYKQLLVEEIILYKRNVDTWLLYGKILKLFYFMK